MVAAGRLRERVPVVQNQRSTGMNPAVAVISSILPTDRLMRFQVTPPN